MSDNYSLDNEKNKHPYNYYGSVFEEEHGNTKFLFKSALKYVVDDVDEYLQSVEQSHYEDLGYFKVTNFSFLEPTDILDLTWMKKNDIFCIDDSDQYHEIHEIHANVDNLAHSSLPKNVPNKVSLVVDYSNSSLNVINQIRAFKSFVNEHVECLNHVEFKGLSPFLEGVLSEYTKRNGIEVVESISEEKKAKK